MAAITTSDTAPAAQPARRVAAKHHWLVRVTHWANIPLLLGMTVSGLSIYWAAPVFKHRADPVTGNEDYFQSFGIWVVKHLPLLAHGYGTADGQMDPGDWFYNHFALGTGELAAALNWHWLFAYLFMLNGLLYLVGLGLGGGYKSLLPRRGDIRNALRMQLYYVGLPIAKLLKKDWPHPHVTTKYNALQRAAYFSMPVAGTLAVLTGWAIHKPTQLGWLAALFGGYNWARVWHFWLMWLFVAFVVPHVILVLADGWDTLRSMIVGWTERLGPQGRSIRNSEYAEMHGRLLPGQVLNQIKEPGAYDVFERIADNKYQQKARHRVLCGGPNVFFAVARLRGMERAGAGALLRKLTACRKAKLVTVQHKLAPADAGLVAVSRVELAPADAGLKAAGCVVNAPADAGLVAAGRVGFSSADAGKVAAGCVVNAPADAGLVAVGRVGFSSADAGKRAGDGIF